MTKVRSLVEDALREAGVLGLGHTLSAEDYQSALRRLNFMLAEWQTTRHMLYKLENKNIESTGASAYTIGPTGNIVYTIRPSKLYGAFFQVANNLIGGDFSTDFSSDFEVVITSNAGNTDIPLIILPAREDYNRIQQKRQSGDPCYCYYEPSMPNGTVYLWPVPPPGRISLVLTVLTPLQVLTSLNTEITLPPEYLSALHYNLAVRLALSHGRAENPGLAAQARNSRNVVKKANTQIPLLRMPERLPMGERY